MEGAKIAKFFRCQLKQGRVYFWLAFGILFFSLLIFNYQLSVIKTAYAWTEPTASPPEGNVSPPIWQLTDSDLSTYQTAGVWHLSPSSDATAYLQGMAVFGAKWDGTNWSYYTLENSGENILYIAASSGSTTGSLLKLEYNCSDGSNPNCSPAMVVTHQGNVGIGTTDPESYRLYVDGNAKVTGTLEVGALDAGTLTGTINAANVSQGEFGANTGGGNYFFPEKVGIGTTEPIEKLHLANGSLFIDDGYFITPFGGQGKYQNEVKRSDNFDIANPEWSKYCYEGTYTADTTDIPAPDGTYTADKIVTGPSGKCDGNGTAGRIQSISTTPNTQYTLSIWARGGAGGESFKLGLQDGYGCSFTLTTNWKRYVCTVTSSDSPSRGFQFYVTTPSATYYVWGAQREQGTSANVYVRTDTSAVTSTNYGLVVNSSGPHIFTQGNVGIGTMEPNEKLDIDGNIKLGDSSLADGYLKFRNAWGRKN